MATNRCHLVNTPLRVDNSSDKEFSPGVLTGWGLPFSCGGVLTAQAFGQTFSSPHYPTEYPFGTECVWTIQAPKSQLITLS
ncbi:hypothetical protein COOONC_26312, partial [Cooperia oncophora]